MKISKNSTVAALAACLLVPAGMFAETNAAQTQNRADNYGYDYNRNSSPETGTASLFNSLSFKAFYGVGLTAPAKDMDRVYDDPEINIGGITVEYTRNVNPYFDFVFAGSIGGGSCDYEYLGELTLYTYELEAGINLRAPLGKVVSLFVGPRVGMNVLYAEFDWDRRSWGKEDDTRIGALLGVDAGVVASFNERNALTVGVGYRYSSAQPECRFGEIEKQDWVRFSVGYRLSF